MLNFTMLSEMRNIKAVTIQMEKPLVSADGTIKRIPVIKTDKNFELISHEEILRRTAYKDIDMYMDENFFNDTDMELNYCLIVIYDKKNNTPLLSGRCHYDHKIIRRYLDECTEDLSTYKNPYSRISSLMDEVEKNNFFLADRFSGDKNSKTYLQYRGYLFLEL